MPSVRAAAGCAALLLALPVAAAAGSVRLPHGRPDVRPAPETLRPVTSPAAAHLADALGQWGVVDIDPVTRTPRNLADLSGFLTGPSSADPGDIVLGYVRAHRDLFRLTDAEIGDLQPVRRYADAQGVTHITWRQWHGSLPVVDADLRAHLTSDGRIISIQGAPVADFAHATLRARVPSARAVRTAGAGVRVSQAAANLALAPMPGGVRLVYRVTGKVGATESFVATVDARTGKTLVRHNMIKWAANVWDSYPSDQPGAQFSPHAADFFNDPHYSAWLGGGAVTLDGPNARVYSDANADNHEDPGDQFSSTTAPAATFAPFAGTPCSTTYPCSWDPATAGSWSTNRIQNGAQVFYFLNTFHDWLANPANGVGFDAGAGGMEGADPVLGETLDSANGNGAGLPDPALGQINNSNFQPAVDGTSPTIQLYLFGPDPTDPTISAINANGGDEADIVYHEYTHGLTTRTVTTADGFEALDGFQAWALGEAWSDWYALDYMVANGLQADTASPDLRIGDYVTAGKGIRSEPTDCGLADGAPGCPGAGTAGAGGYTYGDFAKIDATGFDEHANGEIWAQTLWQLRQTVGADEARALITEGLRLTPVYPDFLDARNAIIEATHTLHPADLAAVWQVFTARGMGYWASTAGDNDLAPVQSFDPPPDAGTPRASVLGTVVDDLSGGPVAGASVFFGGHVTPGAAQTSLMATSGSRGTYAVAHVPEHVYPQLFFGKARYFGTRFTNVHVAANPTRVRAAKVRRDWAMDATTGSWFTGTDESSTLGCGPGSAIDGLFGFGWVGHRQLGRDPSLTVKLPAKADLYRIGVAPWAACYPLVDAASVGRSRIETSTNGVTWHPVASPRFVASDLDYEVLFTAPAKSRFGVRFVRITLLGNQGGDPLFPGDIGMSELTVYALPVLTVRATLTRAGSGRAKLRLTCNQPCSTRVGRTGVRLAAAGTITKSVTASGSVTVTVKATRTGRTVSKTVRVR
jgi:extracellular elastinolytic metalloproteinase